MHNANLSFDYTPPLSVPLRFLLTAPVFAIAAGLVLAAAGPVALSHSASPWLLAVTHLLTLGFAAMVMLGVLFQIIPVLCGGTFPRPRMVAAFVHVALAGGCAALAAAFAGAPVAPVHAAALLAAGFVVFLLAATIALLRSPARGPSSTTIALALVALLVTLTLGVTLAARRSGFALPGLPVDLISLHAGWGLLGWIGLLVTGVAYQVVPMFQVTPSYPRILQRVLGTTLFALLVVWSAHALSRLPDLLVDLAEAAIGIGFAAFALTTLVLQSRRRRRIADVTFSYWRAAMVCLLAAIGLWSARAAGGVAAAPATDIALGILVLIGFAQSVINGMLYKIVPFLAWLHLQRAGIRGRHMHEFINDGYARAQLGLHLAALVLLLGALAWPVLVRVAAGVYAAANVLLGFNLALGAVRYGRYRCANSDPPRPAGEIRV